MHHRNLRGLGDVSEPDRTRHRAQWGVGIYLPDFSTTNTLIHNRCEDNLFDGIFVVGAGNTFDGTSVMPMA
jgi:parallel beta-helix repeat protein